MNEYLKTFNEAVIDTSAETSLEVISGLVGTATGNPAVGISLMVGTRFMAGIIKSSMQAASRDICSRQLSSIQFVKLERVCRSMACTLLDLSENDVSESQNIHSESQDYIQNSFEIAEHIFINAINESQHKKLDVLGRFYANAIYQGCEDWHNIHQITNIIDGLTFRQIVMIRLLAENRLVDDDEKLYYICNKTACVEMWRLLDLGMWRTDGMTFGQNNSYMLAYSMLIPTEYAKDTAKRLMLDKIEQSEVEEVINSMQIGYINRPAEEETSSEEPSDGKIKKLNMSFSTYGEE